MWVEEVFTDIVQLTPQWSGNLASNWYLGVGTMGEQESVIPEKAFFWPLDEALEAFERGDSPAVERSLDRLSGVDFGYLDTVYIYNPSAIAQDVEDESIYIRPVNKVGGQVFMVAHAYSYYSSFQPSYL